jgi:hypothetical protein
LSNLISCGSIARSGLIKWGSADLSAEPVAASKKNFIYICIYMYALPYIAQHFLGKPEPEPETLARTRTPLERQG